MKAVEFGSTYFRFISAIFLRSDFLSKCTMKKFYGSGYVLYSLRNSFMHLEGFSCIFLCRRKLKHMLFLGAKCRLFIIDCRFLGTDNSPIYLFKSLFGTCVPFLLILEKTILKWIGREAGRARIRT